MKNLIIATFTFTAVSLLSPNVGIAGCDKEIADNDLQVAAPLTEQDVRALIAQAERDSDEASSETQTAGR